MTNTVHTKSDLRIILGLGKTGLSCVRFLAERGYVLAVMDSRENPPLYEQFKKEFPDIPVSLGRFDGVLLDKACELIISPGISLSEPAIQKQIQRGIPAIGDIELFARECQSPIVGITGSNAKSTVTTLLGEMLNKYGVNVCVGGNLGTPVLELLNLPKPDFYILELSSFQLETTHSLQCVAGTILNVSADHMDRYASFDDYINAKQRIYNNCKHIIVNRDDQNTYPNATHSVSSSFGLSEPKEGQFGIRLSDETPYLAFGNEKLMPCNKVKIKGQHNWTNALAALALAQALKLPFEQMLETLKEFPGLPHRCQWVAEYNEIAWYNDSKGTNIGACVAALDGLGGAIKGKIVLIAGGQGKGADFRELADSAKRHTRDVIVFGEDANAIEDALLESVNTQRVSSMEAAVELAKAKARPGDVVLFSPACASFDMFDNFEHRGNAYMEIVKTCLDKEK